METTSVTSKGQVTIPKEVRQKLGIQQGSKIEFLINADSVEIRLKSSPAKVASNGFGLLKSKKLAVPADFDVASLLK